MTKPMKKNTTRSLEITRGAAHLLAQMTSATGLVTGDGHEATIYHIGEFNCSHLSALTPAPELPAIVSPKRPTKAELSAVQTFDVRHLAWAAKPMAIDGVAEHTVDALRVVFKAALAKGIVPPGKHCNSLMLALGLAPEDT